MRKAFLFLKFLFRKNKTECPICHYRSPEFATYPIKNRKNAQCHDCGSFERHRLIWLYLNSNTKLFHGDAINILHFAPEKMFRNIFTSKPYITYHCCDLNPEDFDFYVSKQDMVNLTYANNSFDVILCSDVLEHIQDDKKAMSELYRVMKPGGWGIFQVPVRDQEKTYEDHTITDPSEREKHFGQNDHVRWYGNDYPDRLRNAGFVVKEEDYKSSLSREEILKYGLAASGKVYYCEKL